MGLMLLVVASIGGVSAAQLTGQPWLYAVPVAAALEANRRAGLPPPWLNAQASVQGFYERAGFQTHGDIFMEAGIPHRKMRWRGSRE